MKTFYTLEALPAGATLHDVTAQPVETAGRSGLRVVLAQDWASRVTPAIEYHDEPTFVRIPADFCCGIIEFDVCAGLLSDAPDYARAFAGIAYRITPDCDRFESVYLRPTNGLKLNPPSPRDQRAVQYFAFPDWKYERLREEFPDGRYEAGADIRPDEWTHVLIEVREESAVVRVNDIEVLHIDQTLCTAIPGDIGLWVDMGTEAVFANLAITKSDR